MRKVRFPCNFFQLGPYSSPNTLTGLALKSVLPYAVRPALFDMKPITKLASTQLPDGSILELWERDGFHFLLRDGMQPASSFSHGSNETAAAIATAPVKRANQPSFLLDGLGLGFTLFSLMDQVQREKASFVVAEPCRELVDWHREFLDGERPGFLHDPRVSVEFSTALQVARKQQKAFHAILCRSTHDRMNLSVAEASDYFAALKQGGLLVITVARPDTRLVRTLQKAGFEVSTEAVPASHKGKKTTFHTVILGKKGRFVPFSARQS